MKSSNEVIIHIHCHKLPGSRFEERTAVRLGIQKSKEVVDDVPADGSQVTFTIPMRVERDSETGKPNFLGPFAHGTPQERFLYLCWGEREGKNWDGFRRAKVHLKHLTWRQVEVALQQHQPIEFSFDMTDAKGGPACGSLNLHNPAASGH
jgi:hypothetical protein